MLEVVNIDKSYEGKPLLRGVSFAVKPDETICLLGPSGSGKSTLLLIISGLESAESGQVLWDGKDLALVPAHRRDFGLVFQDYALFPHFDVFDNIAFGLRMRHWLDARIRPRVLEVLELVDLVGFDHRNVTSLSGGEQQRVALARALAPHPRLLMFDEPLGALDRALREQLLAQLRRILRETRLPAVYVTHDQSEALSIADRVLLLHAGEIIREGPISDVWAHPGSAWAAEFLDLGSILAGNVLDDKGHTETVYGTFTIKCGHKHKRGDSVKLLARSHQVQHGIDIRSRVLDVILNQEQFKVTLEGGLSIYMDISPQIGREISARIGVECLG